MRPYSEKTPPQKRAGGVPQGVGPEFKPQYCQKRERERERQRESPYFNIKIPNFKILVTTDRTPLLQKSKIRNVLKSKTFLSVAIQSQRENSIP
jgi:hypothetical protein